MILYHGSNLKLVKLIYQNVDHIRILEKVSIVQQ